MVFALAVVAGTQAENYSYPTQYLNATPTPTPARKTAGGRTPASAPASTPVPVRSIAPAHPATTAHAATPARTATPAHATATPAAAPALVKHENVNDIARFIAGLPPEHDEQLAALAKTDEWTAYAAYMDTSWPRFDHVKLQQIRLWTANEFAKKRISTVFYPFSGPDFVYAATYFPQASTCILCGLEPVGDVPSADKLQPLAMSLGWLQASFKTLLNAGYFVTSDMKVELNMSPMQGTIPIMCVMLARLGDRIDSISTGPSFAEIRFVPAAGGSERSLYYFSADLSNGGFGKGGLLGFLKKTHADTAYVKSASYLMHEDEFSAVRNLLLTQFNTIVQDDSGIPLRDFDPRRWKLKLYGSYAPPLDIFAKYNQPDMADLYKKTPGVPPLTFGVGYHWNYKEANLLVATAQSPAAPAVTPPPALSHTHR